MKLLKVLLTSMILMMSAFADREVKIAWDPNDPAEMVTAYAVLINGVEQAPVDTTSATITIPDTSTSISVRAINVHGQKSEPSAAIIAPPSPKNPTGVRITQIIRITISTPVPK